MTLLATLLKRGNSTGGHVTNAVKEGTFLLNAVKESTFLLNAVKESTFLLNAVKEDTFLLTHYDILMAYNSYDTFSNT